ncbi:hypothetical protein KGF54_001847 [Candida jiufengensis]|uniref:uncharacterized protein n=1 Tax=Candida jiufengensis TaxID=497108 RepID=UPI00222583FB|nr:uncharacterized protein KGF54_001847 [Candida jiufengensis]KAI5955286.1 hypothetical protein KGF54_001847 [Candida jiufengensis]
MSSEEVPMKDLSHSQQSSQTISQQPKFQYQNDAKPITTQPQSTDDLSEPMRYQPQSNETLNNNQLKPENSNSSSSSSSSSGSDFSGHTNRSGYHREGNECTEFCIEFCTCFGVVDCCPNNGDGCVTSVATFVGNLIFGCCKC